MFKILRNNRWIGILLVVILASACQPIRPEAALSGSQCTEQDKVNVVQAYVNGVNNNDADAAVHAFLEDAVYSLDTGPRPDPVTGKYVSPDTIEFSGHDQIKWLMQFFVDNNIDKTILSTQVNGDSMVVNAQYDAPDNVIFGTPATRDINFVYTIEIKDCKIAHLHMTYPEEQLAAFVEDAKKLDAECSDEYKSLVFQQYITGIDNGDPILAALPYAKDTHYEFQPIPVWSETDQRYINKPLNTYEGSEAFRPIIDYFISIMLYKVLDLSSLSLNGNTLNVQATLSSDSFSGEPWLLPVTELQGAYTITFNDQCKIADLKWQLAEGSADNLTELKMNK